MEAVYDEMEPVNVMQVTQIYEIYGPLVTRQYYSPRAEERQARQHLGAESRAARRNS
jgi:hypothetical protein